MQTSPTESRSTRRVLAALALAALVAAACRTSVPTLDPERALPGSSWRLVAMDGVAVEGHSLPTLTFGPEGVFGDGGCNRYHASAEIEGTELLVGPVSSTRRACAPPIQDRETRYLELLFRARRVEVTEEFLAIRCDGAPSPLRFTRWW